MKTEIRHTTERYVGAIEQQYGEFATVETIHEVEDGYVEGTATFTMPVTNGVNDDGSIRYETETFRFDYNAEIAEYAETMSDLLTNLEPRPVYVGEAADAVLEGEVKQDEAGYIVDTLLPKSYVADEVIKQEGGVRHNRTHP